MNWRLEMQEKTYPKHIQEKLEGKGYFKTTPEERVEAHKKVFENLKRSRSWRP